MLKVLELNDYHIMNPDGISGGIPQYLPGRFPNEQPGFIDQFPAKSVPQRIDVPQTCPWRPEEDRRLREADEEEESGRDKRRGRPPSWRSDTRRESPRQRSLWDDEGDSGGADSSGGSTSFMSGTVTALGSAAVTAAAYVSSLIVTLTPCAATTDSLAFASSVRNPDNAPLEAVLTADGVQRTVRLESGGYLRFDGLAKDAAYELTVVNRETGKTVYHKNYTTASEDPFEIAVENAEVSPEGAFSFDLTVNGLEAGDFYTLTALDPAGHALYTLDSTDPAASFSVELGDSWRSGGPMPFVTVGIRGMTFMPRIWEPAPPSDGGAADDEESGPGEEQPGDEELPEEVPEEEPGGELPEEEPDEESGEAGTEPAAEPDRPAEAAVPAENGAAANAVTGLGGTPGGGTGAGGGTGVNGGASPGAPAGAAADPAGDETDSEPPAEEETAGETPTDEEPADEEPFGGEPAEEDETSPEAAPLDLAGQQYEIPPAVSHQGNSITYEPDEEEDSGDSRWTWSGSSAAYNIPDAYEPDGVLTVDAEVTRTVTKEADCDEEGSVTYTAVAVGPDGNTYTDTRVEAVPALGHRWQRNRLEIYADHVSTDYVCTVCGEHIHMTAETVPETAP